MDRPQTIQIRLDALTGSMRVPGLQYLVVGPERDAFEYIGGWADLAARAPMLGTTTMMAYSMSKTITAAAVLRLTASRGQSLDAPLGELLDCCPYGPGVTIRRLLAHTAGVPNPMPLRWIHSPAEHAAFDEHSALADVLRRHARPSFRPGSRYGYSNIGYWLLGALVERLSGMPFATYVERQILAPLSIGPEELGYCIPDLRMHARGYLEKYSLLNLLGPVLLERRFIGPCTGRWREIRPHYIDGAAFGGLVGTARGFARFLQDQLRPHSVLFSDAVRRQFHAQQHAAGVSTVPTTLGWHVGGQGATRFLYKEGGGAGFHCLMRLYPLCGSGSIVMANASAFDVRRLLDTCDPAFLAVH
jgi:CubicO group peptidase (beta-lactamase class C family)